MLLRQKEQVLQRQQELFLIQKKIENRLSQLNDALTSALDTITLETKRPRRLALIKKDLIPKSYLDLEYSIRELEQEEEMSMAFLGKVGIGLSRERLLEKRFHPYEIIFMILDDEDYFKGKTLALPEETCVTVKFQGSHENAAKYYEKLMQYIEKEKLSVCGFSKEITMIDYGLTDDVSKFVTEIQIPVSENPD